MARQAVRRWLRLPLKVIPKKMVLPILGGPNRGYKWVVGSANNGCWLGQYESYCSSEVAKLLTPSMTTFDVGAHVGYYSLLMATRVKRVVSFEANSANVEKLRHHVAINQLNNVEIVDAAVGDSTGITHFEGEGYTGRVSAQGKPIRRVKLDDYGDPDFVKMDIEGGEISALDGAANIVNKKRTIWFIATHGEHCLSYALDRLVGYQIKRISQDEFFAFPPV